MPVDARGGHVRLFREKPDGEGVIAVLFDDSFRGVEYEAPDLGGGRPLAFCRFPNSPHMLLRIIPPLRMKNAIRPVGPCTIP